MSVFITFSHYFASANPGILSSFSALGNDPQVVEEEYIIDQPAGKRKVKVPLSTPRRLEL